MTATKLESIFSGLLCLGFVLFMVLVAIGFALPNGQFDVLRPFLLGIFFVEAAFMLGAHVARSRARSFLEEIDYRMCPECRYLLTGLGDEGRCPECSAHFEPQQLRYIWKLRYEKKHERWMNSNA